MTFDDKIIAAFRSRLPQGITMERHEIERALTGIVTTGLPPGIPPLVPRVAAEVLFDLTGQPVGGGVPTSTAGAPRGLRPPAPGGPRG